MAVSLAFGVLFATVVTLLVVPASYTIFEDIRALFNHKKPDAVADADSDADAGMATKSLLMPNKE